MLITTEKSLSFTPNVAVYLFFSLGMVASRPREWICCAQTFRFILKFRDTVIDQRVLERSSWQFDFFPQKRWFGMIVLFMLTEIGPKLSESFWIFFRLKIRYRSRRFEIFRSNASPQQLCPNICCKNPNQYILFGSLFKFDNMNIICFASDKLWFVWLVFCSFWKVL